MTENSRLLLSGLGSKRYFKKSCMKNTLPHLRDYDSIAKMLASVSADCTFSRSTTGDHRRTEPFNYVVEESRTLGRRLASQACIWCTEDRQHACLIGEGADDTTDDIMYPLIEVLTEAYSEVTFCEYLLFEYMGKPFVKYLRTELLDLMMASCSDFTPFSIIDSIHGYAGGKNINVRYGVAAQVPGAHSVIHGTDLCYNTRVCYGMGGINSNTIEYTSAVSHDYVEAMLLKYYDHDSNYAHVVRTKAHKTICPVGMSSYIVAYESPKMIVMQGKLNISVTDVADRVKRYGRGRLMSEFGLLSLNMIGNTAFTTKGGNTSNMESGLIMLDSLTVGQYWNLVGKSLLHSAVSIQTAGLADNMNPFLTVPMAEIVNVLTLDEMRNTEIMPDQTLLDDLKMLNSIATSIFSMIEHHSILGMHYAEIIYIWSFTINALQDELLVQMLSGSSLKQEQIETILSSTISKTTCIIKEIRDKISIREIADSDLRITQSLMVPYAVAAVANQYRCAVWRVYNAHPMTASNGIYLAKTRIAELRGMRRFNSALRVSVITQMRANVQDGFGIDEQYSGTHPRKLERKLVFKAETLELNLKASNSSDSSLQTQPLSASSSVGAVFVKKQSPHKIVTYVKQPNVRVIDYIAIAKYVFYVNVEKRRNYVSMRNINGMTKQESFVMVGSLIDRISTLMQSDNFETACDFYGINSVAVDTNNYTRNDSITKHATRIVAAMYLLGSLLLVNEEHRNSVKGLRRPYALVNDNINGPMEILCSLPSNMFFGEDRKIGALFVPYSVKDWIIIVPTSAGPDYCLEEVDIFVVQFGNDLMFTTADAHTRELLETQARLHAIQHSVIPETIVEPIKEDIGKSTRYAECSTSSKDREDSQTGNTRNAECSTSSKDEENSQTGNLLIAYKRVYQKAMREVKLPKSRPQTPLARGARTLSTIMESLSKHVGVNITHVIECEKSFLRIQFAPNAWKAVTKTISSLEVTVMSTLSFKVEFRDTEREIDAFSAQQLASVLGPLLANTRTKHSSGEFVGAVIVTAVLLHGMRVQKLDTDNICWVPDEQNSWSKNGFLLDKPVRIPSNTGICVYEINSLRVDAVPCVGCKLLVSETLALEIKGINCIDSEYRIYSVEKAVKVHIPTLSYRHCEYVSLDIEAYIGAGTEAL